jgi:hypothetical protein
MPRVGDNTAKRITEHRRRFLESDFVFDDILRSFLRVPLELQRQLSLYVLQSRVDRAQTTW